MNKFKTKKSFSYRDLLYKALIFIGTVAIIVYFLPRDGKFNYQFDIDERISTLSIGESCIFLATSSVISSPPATNNSPVVG